MTAELANAFKAMSKSEFNEKNPIANLVSQRLENEW